MGEAKKYILHLFKIKRKRVTNFQNLTNLESRWVVCTRQAKEFPRVLCPTDGRCHLVEAEFRGCQGANLQIGQKGFDAFADRRHPEGLSRRRSGEICDWDESSAHFEGERSGFGNPRGSLPHDQEGSLHQETFGEKQEGPRCQVSFDLDRVSYSPFGALLQNQTRFAAYLEIRVLHRLRPRRLILSGQDERRGTFPDLAFRFTTRAH